MMSFPTGTWCLGRGGMVSRLGLAIVVTAGTALLAGCVAPHAGNSAPAERVTDIYQVSGVSATPLTTETAFPPVRTVTPPGSEVARYRAMLQATEGMKPGKVAAGRRVELELRKPQPPYEERPPLLPGPAIKPPTLPKLPWPFPERDPESG